MAVNSSHVPDIESDIRERSFQNIIKNIFVPAGVKMGGYSEDMFIELNETEKEEWTCGICYTIVREVVSCDNDHHFCNTCAFAWSMTYGVNSQMCPMCRNKQTSYKFRKDIDELIEEKEVRCVEPDCTFSSALKVFLMHNHGKTRYKNAVDDLETLRTPRHNTALVLSQQNTNNLSDRYTGLRDQLTRGRVMVSQMMLLLQLEMQLRQQAMIGYVQATNPEMRAQHLDEVLALNEQLNEVGSILNHILHDPRNANSSSHTGTRSSITQGNSLPRIDSPLSNNNENTEYHQSAQMPLENIPSNPRGSRNNSLSQSTNPFQAPTVIPNQHNPSYSRNDNHLSDGHSVSSSNNQNSNTHLPPINDSSVSPGIIIPTLSQTNNGDFTIVHEESNGPNSSTSHSFRPATHRQSSESVSNDQYSSSNSQSSPYVNQNRHSNIEINVTQTNMNDSDDRHITTTRTYSAQRHISRPSRRDQSVILRGRRLSHSTASHPVNPRTNDSGTVNQHLHTSRRSNSNIRNRQQGEMGRTASLQNSTSNTITLFRPTRRSEIREKMLNLNSIPIKKK